MSCTVVREDLYPKLRRYTDQHLPLPPENTSFSRVLFFSRVSVWGDIGDHYSQCFSSFDILTCWFSHIVQLSIFLWHLYFVSFYAWWISIIDRHSSKLSTGIGIRKRNRQYNIWNSADLIQQILRTCHNFWRFHLADRIFNQMLFWLKQVSSGSTAMLRKIYLSRLEIMKLHNNSSCWR